MSTVNPVDVELTKEAGERAFRECMELYASLLDRNLGPTGETYGSVETPRADRIAQFLIDRQDGTLTILEVQSPEVFKRYVEQFEKDVAESPMFGETKSDQRLREVPDEGIV